MTAVSARAMAPASFATLADLLRHRAAATPDDPAYIELSDRGQELARLTFAELAGRSAHLAQRIADRAGPGDRALLVCPNGVGFMVGFFACVLTRVAAVPVMVPRRNSARDASAGIVADCTPVLALAPRALIGGERGDLAARFANAGHNGIALEFLAVDDAETAPAPFDTDRPPARPGRHRVSAIHLRLNLGAEGSDGQPRQSAGESGDDRAGLRQYEALDPCQLGPALSRHGTDHKRAAEPLHRLFLRADDAGRVRTAPAGLAARHKRVPRRDCRRSEFRVRSVRRSLPSGADGRNRPVRLEGRLQRRRAGAGRVDPPFLRNLRAARLRPLGDAAGLRPGRGNRPGFRRRARRRPGDANRQPRSPARRPCRAARQSGRRAGDCRMRKRDCRRADRDRRSRHPDPARRRADRRDLGRRPQCRARLLEEPRGERRRVRGDHYRRGGRGRALAAHRRSRLPRRRRANCTSPAGSRMS